MLHMLDIMRKHARNWLMKVILGIIIVVFVFYFGSLRGRQQAQMIAVLDDKPIVYVDFQKEYEDLLEMYRQRMGAALNEEVIKSLNIKRQAFDNLINQAVLLKKAEDMNIRVSDEDVRNLILSYPAFQRNGVFDNTLYERSLRANRMTPEQFERSQKTVMLTGQVESLIQEAIHVSEEETLAFYHLQNQKVNLDFIRIFPYSYIADVHPSKEALESFLQTNKGRFQVPEQFQIKYLLFSPGDYASDISLSDAEIRDYYERKREQFKKDNKIPPLVEVRDRIIDEMRQIAAMNRAQEKAREAHDTIYQEENFDLYATNKKLRIHTTGFFTLDNIPVELRSIKEIRKTMARLENNEISRVLQGNDGYYIIKISARRAPYLPKLKDIENEIEHHYKQQEAKKLAEKDANDLLTHLKKGDRIEALANNRGLTILQTGLFKPGKEIPKLGSSAEITEAVFQLSVKNPYPEKVFFVKDHYVVIRLHEIEKANERDFASQKEALAAYLLKIKQTEVLRRWLEKTREDFVKEGRLKFIRDVKDL